MKLKQLASKPKLIKQIIDDAEIVDKYGETVEFYLYDRYDMDTLMKLASVDSENYSAITGVVEDLILDENGDKIIVDDFSLPLDIMLKAVEVVVSQLGNMASQTTAK